MRFTVKAKLASTFGAVIALSIITGAVAYSKLSTLDKGQDHIVEQAGKMRAAAEMIDDIQEQQRAETRMIAAVSDKDTADFYNAMIARRDIVLKKRDELFNAASDEGRRILDQATGKLKRMNDLEEQIGKFALLNSNNRAAELWKNEGQPAVKELNAALDAAAAELSKTSSSSENPRAQAAVLTAKVEVERLWRFVISAIAATSMEDVTAEARDAATQINVAKSAIAQMAAAGLSSSSINVQYERLAKAADKVVGVAQEGGNIKAAVISGGDGRSAFDAALAGFGDYAKYAKQRTQEISAEGSEEAAFAKTLLISIILASALIAVVSAAWIALNISRGLGRAVGLADAVAIGDLSQKIDVSSNDEIGDLIKSLNVMTVNLDATAKVADTIAGGNLTIEAKRLSDKDTLGIALERMIEKLRSIVAEAITAAQNVSAGSQGDCGQWGSGSRRHHCRQGL